MTVVYDDHIGSGVETIAHLRENGRVLIMFAAFEGPTRILRIHGTGHVIFPGEEGFDHYATLFGQRSGRRSIIQIAVSRIQDSCGYGVPHYVFSEQRKGLDRWVAAKSDEEIHDHVKTRNAKSIDGLPGFES